MKYTTNHMKKNFTTCFESLICFISEVLFSPTSNNEISVTLT